MELKEFIKLEDQVKQILMDYPRTRNDDMYLYYVYCMKKLGENNITKIFEFSTIFCDKRERELRKIKPYQSVERCRRKIQAEFPELSSEKVIKTARKEEEKEYIEYSRL